MFKSFFKKKTEITKTGVVEIETVQEDSSHIEGDCKTKNTAQEQGVEEALQEESIESVDTPLAEKEDEEATANNELPPEDVPSTSWVKRLGSGLRKSSKQLTRSLASVLLHKKLDQDTIDALEEVLIASDMGVHTSSMIVSKLAKDRFDSTIDTNELMHILEGYISEILSPVAKPLTFKSKVGPECILMCGVNGNGKTTTIGKLANQYAAEGKKVMLVACDTFRAAAVEQLAVWAERSNGLFIKGEHEQDPASVAYTAYKEAEAQSVDVVLIDTAGRLHNKKALMEELAKIIRVLQKCNADIPHHTLLVLDATTGQNAFHQVETFKQIVNISGMIITKLDGTAKGGVVVGLADQFQLPIYAVGVGEMVDDLHHFNAQDFAKHLLGITNE